MDFRRIDIVFILAEEANLRDKICQFLPVKDLVNLSLISKAVQPIIANFKSNYSFNKFIDWKESKINQVLPKGKQKKQQITQVCKVIKTGENIIIKNRLFEVPQTAMLSSLWNFLPGNDKKLINRIKDEKFIVEHNNFFFENKNGDIMFMNRSLIDKNLDISNLQDEMDESKEEKYHMLHKGDEYSSISYDFSSMESMKARQKKLIGEFDSEISQKMKDGKFENILDQIKIYKRVTLILCYGGSFSIGIFEKGKCIFHKSDKKYVVRGKAGGRQLNKDKSSGSNIQSIGSQIRRDQERKHQTNVTNILTEHLEDIDKSDIVFLQAPGLNKMILISENEPLRKVQHKLRSLCLTSKKANYTEVERLFKVITKVYFVFKVDQKQLE